MNEEEQRGMLLEFERNRQMLGNVTAQKQQVAFQLEMIDASLEELGKTKEKNVYKVVGNLLFLKDTKEMEKELKERKESTDLRLKTLEKQEDNLVKKLNTTRAKLEAEMKPKEAEEEPKEKSDKANKRK